MMREKLRQLQESEENTEELFGSSHELTKDDEAAIASLCVWNGDKESAEFWHLIRSMISNLGRGSEIAVLKWKHLSLTEVVESDRTTYQTPILEILRLKLAVLNGGKVDRLHHFVHVDDFKRCYIFSMFYHMVLDDSSIGNEDGDMFPSWVGYVKKRGPSNSRKRKATPQGKTSQRIDSEVSKKFTAFWKRICNIAKKYVDCIEGFQVEAENVGNDDMVEHYIEVMNHVGIDLLSQGATTHSSKHFGVQILGDTNIAPQHISARAGWLLKTFNTFFDYWQGVGYSMKVTGKALSGWKVGGNGDNFCSGVPPTFESIKHLAQERIINQVVEHLLGHRNDLSLKMKRLLVANGIRFIDDLENELELEPLGNYKNHELRCTNHPFIQKAIHYAGVDFEHFQQWKNAIRDGYHMSNCYAVPKFISKFGNCAVTQIPQNVTLSDMLVHQEIRNNFQLQSIHNLRNEVEELKNIVSRQHHELMKKNDDILKLLQHRGGSSSEVLLENENVTRNQDIQKKEMVPLMSYGVIREMCNSEVEVAAKVRVFIISEMQKAYDKLDPSQKKVQKSGFCKFKKGIDLVLNCLPEGVNLTVPSIEECGGNLNVLMHWKFELSKHLEETCIQLRNKLVEGNKIPGNAKLSINLLLKHKDYLENQC